MTDQNAPILVIGEALIDIVQADGREPVEHVGGSPANVAIGLTRLGHAAELTTWIGNDARGERIRSHLAADHVTLTPGSQAAERTSTALAQVDAEGVATYEFDLDWRPPVPEVSAPAVHLHIGSIGATMAPGASVVTHAVTTHRAHATVSYDPNIRPTLMGEPDDVRTRVDELVALSDIVKASDEDATWLHPDLTPAQLVQRWVDLGASLAVITLGPDGAVAATAATGVIQAPSPKVNVADTVGAGDSFMAGLLDGLAAAGFLGTAGRARLAQITPAQVEALLRRGIATASITVSRPGANPPTTAEVGPAII